MWKAIGVQAELVNREVKVHYDELKQHNFDVARAAWVADYNDPQNFLYLLETRTGPNNYSEYSNAKFDELMMEQAASRDQAQRMQFMHEAEKIAIDDDALKDMNERLRRTRDIGAVVDEVLRQTVPAAVLHALVVVFAGEGNDHFVRALACRQCVADGVEVLDAPRD